LIKTLSFIFILTLLSSSLHAQELIIRELATVIKITDGDTLLVRYGGQREKVRRLGYIFLPNGKMLNEEIVKAGYANVMTIPPNVKYKDKFLKAYKHARERKRGLWEKEQRKLKI